MNIEWFMDKYHYQGDSKRIDFPPKKCTFLSLILLQVEFILMYVPVDVMCDTGMIEQLVGVLSEEHNSFHEHTLDALLSIVTNHPRAIEECQRPELELCKKLQERIQFLKGKEEFRVMCWLMLLLSIL